MEGFLDPRSDLVFRRIFGLEFVFVELPKFRESRASEARLVRWAWLKFLRDAGDAEKEGHPSVEAFERETAINPALAEAMRIARESNFSPAERNAYDRFWDAVRTERTLIAGKTAEARKEGLEQGRLQGLERARERMLAAGMADAEARKILGLPPA